MAIELRDADGVLAWSGIATSVNGHFTAYVRVPTTAADGVYVLTLAAGGLSGSASIEVDSELSGPT